MQNLCEDFTMNRTIKKAAITLSTFTIITLISSTSVAADKPCKGQEMQACNQSNSCSWVNSYKRKDGKTIKSYCRNSAKSKAKNKTDNIKKQTSTKITKPQKTSKTTLEKTSKI